MFFPTATPGDAALMAQRYRIFKWIALAIVVLLIPFGINHFIQGRTLAGFAIVGVILILGANAVAIHFERRPPVPPAIVFIPIGVALWVAIAEQGINAAFWTFPSVLMSHYTLPRRLANVVSGLLSALITTLVYVYVAPATAARVFSTLLLTMFFANVFLGMVERLHQQLQTLAIADPLTGTYNRRHMDTSLGIAVALKKRHGTPMSLLLLDIDHFKLINDEFGHAIGDEVLKKVAALINGSLRKIDLLFRIGGEEFAVLLPETDQSAAMQVAEKLRSAIAARPLHGDRTVTISIGVGELHADEESHGLLKRCDDALYQAKTEGRDRVCAATA